MKPEDKSKFLVFTEWVDVPPDEYRARRVEVEDGHLVIYSWPDEVIAAYPPGAWLRCTKQD